MGGTLGGAKTYSVESHIQRAMGWPGPFLGEEVQGLGSWKPSVPWKGKLGLRFLLSFGSQKSESGKGHGPGHSGELGFLLRTHLGALAAAPSREARVACPRCIFSPA